LTQISAIALKLPPAKTCSFQEWCLHAINVRTNHVHLVVSIGDKNPELALNAFKSERDAHDEKNGMLEPRQQPVGRQRQYSISLE
jgi:hypothetical protein